jgi:hypothetical protein
MCHNLNARIARWFRVEIVAGWKARDCGISAQAIEKNKKFITLDFRQ